jgi:16S rRNA (guanine(527)-N(7))-methyltransferase RsmG
MLSQMDPVRILSLLEPFLLYPLDAGQLQRISMYINLLQRWNAKTNLTAIRNPEDIVTRHFGESLFAAQVLFPDVRPSDREPGGEPTIQKRIVHSESSIKKDSAILSETKVCPEPDDGRELSAESSQSPISSRRSEDDRAPGSRRSVALTWEESSYQSHAPQPDDLLDLGSGAGFPGMPMQIWSPHLRTTLIESQQKKVAFLRELIRALTLTNINVSPARAEDFPRFANTVTLRAVERFDQILPVAVRRVAPGGRLALLIGELQAEAARTALPKLVWQSPVAIPNSRSRILLVGHSSL